MYWDRKLITSKVEASYGVDAAPTAAANAILAYDVSLNPMEGQDLARSYETPTRGARGTIPVGLYQTLSFKVEMSPSITPGTPPWWDPLIRACGCARTVVANTSVTYTRVSEGEESVTNTVNFDGIFFRQRGSRGNAKFLWEVLKQPLIEFSFSGLFEEAEDQDIPVANLQDQIGWSPKPVSTANTQLTWNGSSLITTSFALDLGNTIKPSFAIGREEIMLSDVSETIDVSAYAVRLPEFNPYALAYAQTKFPATLRHGSGPGDVIQLDVPRAQHRRPGAFKEIDGRVAYDLSAEPLHLLGDDQFTLTLT